MKRPRGEARGKNADERTKRFLDVLFSREISKSRVINKDNTTRIDCAVQPLEKFTTEVEKKSPPRSGEKNLISEHNKNLLPFPRSSCGLGRVSCPQRRKLPAIYVSTASS